MMGIIDVIIIVRIYLVIKFRMLEKHVICNAQMEKDFYQMMKIKNVFLVSNILILI